MRLPLTPLEPDAVTGSEATISARAYGTTLFVKAQKRVVGDFQRGKGTLQMAFSFLQPVGYIISGFGFRVITPD